MSAPFVIGQGLRGSVTRVWEKPAKCKIQLNINMAIAGRNPSLMWFDLRFNVIDHLVQNNSDWTVLRRGRADRQVECDYTDSLVLQHVYVAEIECDTFTQDMRQFLTSLSDVLGQGCIAVMHPSTNHGTLIGSDPATWGEFDINKFITMDEVQA